MRLAKEPNARERARGRWPSILASMGLPAKALSGKHGPCPICREGKDRFRFDDKNQVGTWICSKCGAGDGFKLVMLLKGLDFIGAKAEVEKHLGAVPATPPKPERSDDDKRAALNRMWTRATPITVADAAGRFLFSRTRLTEFPGCLRFVPDLVYLDDTPSRHPAMIARVSGPDGKPVTLHRTYLTPEGGKAAVEAPRRLMEGVCPPGSAVRLAEAGPVLGVAEGIETALAASSLFRVPVWATINTSILKTFMPPPGVRRLIIFADNDSKFGGQAAAFSLAYRLAGSDLTVDVEIPPKTGTDWNDVFLEKKGAACLVKS